MTLDQLPIPLLLSSPCGTEFAWRARQVDKATMRRRPKPKPGEQAAHLTLSITKSGLLLVASDDIRGSRGRPREDPERADARIVRAQSAAAGHIMDIIR